ncbi:Dynein heavy chain 10, axonemal [Bulinus truncatus]|nr:Dynein heavy chain 10, axonemal [Bulinus truncatus]
MEFAQKIPMEFAQKIPMEFAQKIPTEFSQKIPMEFAQKIPMEFAQKIPMEFAQKIPMEFAQKTPMEFVQKIPMEFAQKIPMEFAQKIPMEFEHKIPMEFTQKIPMEFSQMIPMEFAQKIPMEFSQKIPMEFSRKIPMELAQKIPMEFSQKIPMEFSQKIPMEFTQKIHMEFAQKIPMEFSQKIPMEFTQKIHMEFAQKIPMEFAQKIPMEFAQKIPMEFALVVVHRANYPVMLGTPTKLYIINPKERPVIELYGVLDPVSRDWTDGLLSNIFREINKPTDRKELRYIVYDGDVDALWVENMNSVMDDNKLLTLSNGERIRLQNYCAMLFEVYDLQYASPATISRCGMVFVDPKNLGYFPFWERWRRGRPQTQGKIFEALYKKYVPGLVDLVVEGLQDNQPVEKLRTILPLTNLNLIQQLSVMLSATLENVEYPAPELEAVMIQALVWSLGAALVEDSRVRFDTYLKYLASMSVIYDPNKLPEPGELPGNGILFDYHFDQVKKKWIAWSKRVPAYVHVPGQKFYDILVPTVETVRATWLLELHVTIRRPVVLVGETGTSKTATILNFLKKINEETTMLLVMNFSSRTTSLDVQRNLEANMEKRTKDTYGPPSNKRLIIYIDELNMPQVDTYGTQQPIAMLKLLLDRGGAYDRGKELCWKNMRDLGYIASMGKAGGGRNETDPRFVSLFSVFNMTFPDQTSLLKIYVSILDGHVRPFESDLVRYVVKITEMTMELYSHLIKELPPTPSKFHYIFNLRDLSRIYNGLCLSTPDRFSNINQFLRLWRNECMRVICDRLITVEDKHQVQVNVVLRTRHEHILRLIKEYFKEAHMDNISRDPILFGDFRFALDEEEPRIYEDLQDYEACKALFHEVSRWGVL